MTVGVPGRSGARRSEFHGSHLLTAVKMRDHKQFPLKREDSCRVHFFNNILLKTSVVSEFPTLVKKDSLFLHTPLIQGLSS